MSYDLIRSIKIDKVNKKVFLTSACNNVRPLIYHRWECSYLSKIFQEQGQEALDVEILKAYVTGNFQRGDNKYTAALKVLRNLPEYKSFGWRGYDIEGSEKNKEFIELLKKALTTKLPEDKFVIKRFPGVYFVLSKSGRHGYWTQEKKEAKIFNYREEAENVKKGFYNSEDWQVEEIKGGKL